MYVSWEYQGEDNAQKGRERPAGYDAQRQIEYDQQPRLWVWYPEIRNTSVRAVVFCGVFFKEILIKAMVERRI